MLSRHLAQMSRSESSASTQPARRYAPVVVPASTSGPGSQLGGNRAARGPALIVVDSTACLCWSLRIGRGASGSVRSCVQQHGWAAFQRISRAADHQLSARSWKVRSALLVQHCPDAALAFLPTPGLGPHERRSEHLTALAALHQRKRNMERYAWND